MKIISKAYFSRIRCYSQKEQTQPLIYDSFVPKYNQSESWTRHEPKWWEKI